MENNAVKKTARIAGVLVIITTLTAVLLAVINLLTEPVIAENNAATKQAAIAEIFEGADKTESLDSLFAEEYPEGLTELYTVYKGEELLGYCAGVESMGFSDNIGMMVGVTADGKVKGIRILSISDTPGLGMKVNDEDYLSGYEGISYPAAFGEGVDAITGATYSSKGVRNGVNIALEFCSRLTVEGEEETANE